MYEHQKAAVETEFGATAGRFDIGKSVRQACILETVIKKNKRGNEPLYIYLNVLKTKVYTTGDIEEVTVDGGNRGGGKRSLHISRSIGNKRWNM